MRDEPRQPACPRCGYDQSGLIATWTEACPLEGVCSECGLDLRWEELLSSKFAAPEWSFEHAQRGRIGRFVRTHARAVTPPKFWRTLKLEHPVVTRRLLAIVLVWIFAGHLVVSLVSGVRAYRAAISAPPAPPGWVIIGGAPGVGTPGVGTPGTRSPGARPPRPPVRPAMPPGPTPRQIAIQAAIWPYAVTPWRTIGTVRIWAVVAHPGAEMLVFMAMIPPGFLILGETFRRCKVRFVHLLRGAAYSMAVPAMGWVLCALSAVVLSRAPWKPLFLVAVVWLCVYWVKFVRTYLRLPHAGGVAAAMLVIAGLTTLIVMALGSVARGGRW